jgi:hypothetical protein
MKFPVHPAALCALLCTLFCTGLAFAGEKRIFRIDSLIATQKDGIIQLQAKGAVQSGGWTKPRLHVVHGDSHTITVEFLATVPQPGMTVIDALVPVTASAEIKGHATSVHVLADANEITSQVLR